MNRAKRLLISMIALLCCCTGTWALDRDTENYYILSSLQDWQDFAAIVNSGTNPAAIGVFRHSTASVSMGIVSQEDTKRFDQVGKTNFSFDQAGFVYSTQTDRNSFLNFAFNYHPPMPKGQGRLANYTQVFNNFYEEFLGYAGRGLCYVLQLDPQTACTPGRMPLLRDLLEKIKTSGQAWITTGSEMYDYWSSEYPA